MRACPNSACSRRRACHIAKDLMSERAAAEAQRLTQAFASATRKQPRRRRTPPRASRRVASVWRRTSSSYTTPSGCCWTPRALPRTESTRQPRPPTSILSTGTDWPQARRSSRTVRVGRECESGFAVCPAFSGTWGPRLRPAYSQESSRRSCSEMLSASRVGRGGLAHSQEDRESLAAPPSSRQPTPQEFRPSWPSLRSSVRHRACSVRKRPRFCGLERVL